jgi:autotransporter passenger strand-loop-strand repeat protein
VRSGTAIDTVVSGFGADQVVSAGMAINTVVSSGGLQTVQGGIASRTTVLGGGSLNVSRTGTIIGAVLSSGASATIATTAGQVHASGTTVLSGGTQVVFAGIVSGTVLNGGLETVSRTLGVASEEQLALVSNSFRVEAFSTRRRSAAARLRSAAAVSCRERRVSP